MLMGMIFWEEEEMLETQAKLQRGVIVSTHGVKERVKKDT